MSETAGQSGSAQGASTPAGNAAPASGSVDVKAVVAEALAAMQPEVAKMVTGAVKRVTAEEIEAKLTALKGNDGTPKPADKKLSAEEVQMAEMKRQLDALTKESQSYKARALRGGVAELVNKANVTPEAAELLIEKFAGIVQEDQSGALHIKDGDDTRPFGAFLAGYLKDRKGLLKASAREGSGAGGGANNWTENMPKSKRELLWHPTEKAPDGKKKHTPERVAAFKAAHGIDAFNKLPD